MKSIQYSVIVDSLHQRHDKKRQNFHKKKRHHFQLHVQIPIPFPFRLSEKEILFIQHKTDYTSL